MDDALSDLVHGLNDDLDYDVPGTEHIIQLIIGTDK